MCAGRYPRVVIRKRGQQCQQERYTKGECRDGVSNHCFLGTPRLMDSIPYPNATPEGVRRVDLMDNELTLVGADETKKVVPLKRDTEYVLGERLRQSEIIRPQRAGYPFLSRRPTQCRAFSPSSVEVSRHENQWKGQAFPDYFLAF